MDASLKNYIKRLVCRSSMSLEKDMISPFVRPRPGGDGSPVTHSEFRRAAPSRGLPMYTYELQGIACLDRKEHRVEQVLSALSQRFDELSRP